MVVSEHDSSAGTPAIEMTRGDLDSDHRRSDRDRERERERERDRDREREREKERDRERERDRDVARQSRQPVSASNSTSIRPNRAVNSSIVSRQTVRSSVPSLTSEEKDQVIKATLNSMRLEEEQAIANDPSSDASAFIKTISEVRSIMTTMKSQETADPQLNIELALKLVEMKQLNRFEKLRTKNIREKVNQIKGKVDTYYLQLQNLRHEVMYIQKEIKRCLDYKSKVDEAGLESLEEFFKSPRYNSDEKDQMDEDEHKLTLARLEWELEQRINLAKQVAESSALTLEPSKEIRQTQSSLGRLRSSMSTVIEALNPLSQELFSGTSQTGDGDKGEISEDEGGDDADATANVDDSESGGHKRNAHESMEVDEEKQV